MPGTASVAFGEDAISLRAQEAEATWGQGHRERVPGVCRVRASTRCELLVRLEAVDSFYDVEKAETTQFNPWSNPHVMKSFYNKDGFLSLHFFKSELSESVKRTSGWEEG